MFCPNCGNDYGNAKFCTKCGKNIQQNDGSSDAVAPAGGYGQFAHLIGTYKCLHGYVELTPNSVIICKHLPKSTRCEIPYDQIRFVTYMQYGGSRAMGFLSVYPRYSNKPLVTYCDQAERDEMSVVYNYRFTNETFMLLSQFLNGCAVRNRANWFKMREKALPPEVLKLAQSKYDLKHYRQYYPNKREAVSAMHKDTGISEAEARPVIDYVFDVFNNVIFENFDDSLGLPIGVKCPHCFSSRVAANEQGYDLLRSHPSHWGTTFYLMREEKKARYVCVDCGYVWHQE